MSWSKNIVFLNTVFLAMVFAISDSFSQEYNSAADFLKIRREVAFGRINLGETKRIVIKIENISRDTIELEHFTNSCTCLNIINLNRRGIAPEVNDSIVILYNPKRVGYIEENLLLYVKGVTRPLVCKLKGRVVQHILTL